MYFISLENRQQQYFQHFNQIPIEKIMWLKKPRFHRPMQKSMHPNEVSTHSYVTE